MTTLISTYLSLSPPNRTILTVPAGIFVCTFPEIPVQTWCKGVSMIAGGFLVSPHSETAKPAAIINCLRAPSSPAGPARASNLADTLAQNHDVVIIDNLATGRRENIEHLLDHPRVTFVEGSISLEVPALRLQNRKSPLRR